MFTSDRARFKYKASSFKKIGHARIYLHGELVNSVAIPHWMGVTIDEAWNEKMELNYEAVVQGSIILEQA